MRDDAASTDAKVSRREALTSLGKSAALAAAALSLPRCGSQEFDAYFQQHYQEMSKDEVDRAIKRIEANYKERLGADVRVGTAPALEGVVYGYALNVGKCMGYRDCVDACVKENNQGRDPEIQYIRVLELDHAPPNLEGANGYYDDETVPQPGKTYFPVQCQQCDNPPCVSACPVDATWKEKDGIVVIDYDWCIGCRYCAAACPYWARKFNWSEPKLPLDQINTDTHYLSNRPRSAGVMEKCTFCLHRVRAGRMPACQEACPTGARVFGNLLDPDSEIRYVIENKKVFRLKEELNTQPKFWYYSD